MNSLPNQEYFPKKEIKFFVLDITLKGGIERFVANMATLFSEQGFRVTIYSFHRTYSQPLYALPREVEIDYLSTYPFRSGLYKAITLLSCIKIAWLRRSFIYPYVAIATHPITTIYLSLFSSGLLPHTIASEHSTYLAHGGWIRSLRLRCYRGVKCVVTQTQDGAKRFSEAGLPTAKIPNACSDFADSRQWTLVPPVSGHPFTCLSVGRFERVKQLDHYIEMAHIVHQQCPDIHFALVGAGPLEAELRSRIKQYDLEKVFCIHASTPHVNSFYAKAQAYLITSASEAFPMTMIEALSYGVPVLAYDQLVGPKEIIRDGYNGFLCTQNQPAALAAKVLAMYQQPRIYENLPSHALQTARAFHRHAIFQQWLDIL